MKAHTEYLTFNLPSKMAFLAWTPFSHCVGGGRAPDEMTIPKMPRHKDFCSAKSFHPPRP